MSRQRVVVVGGASGIGAATVRLLTDRGARVAVIDRRTESGIVADIRDAAQVDAAVAAAADEMGGITGVVNSAGLGNIRRLEQHSDAEWSRLLAVNLTGPFQVIRAATPFLREAGGGAVVNIASFSALTPTRGEAAYSVAKAGLLALTQSAALELAPAIRVNAISPGFIDTPMTAALFELDGVRSSIEDLTPLGRIGSAEEVAAAVVWLLGDESRFVTGHNLVIDGGAHLIHAQADPVLRRLLGMFEA